MFKQCILGALFITFNACNEPPQRNCNDFKTGKFSFTSVIDGQEKTTTFSRTLDTEVDYFEGKQDTSSVRWINDCEYVLKNINPKSKAEEKSIHIKILTTSDSSYTFEYNAIGDKRKFKGTAHKIH
ncbi:DNA topoisomerase IV [Flagellimonas hymeniacidonis]|uniref:DNA topoisomerase IV n=1 Tax=Flagellimonas hymeniacidonis TaxID=2603628 RepID=A0A5C8V405_9FLAO|nr:DNA topoisomerase IV [Flagellimonas hymeniacidonis]TXN35809.1 DNA topoisomerase IV [Flagellimonas hymeniacidonis]